MKLIWLATEAHQLHHDIVIPVSDLFPETELHSTDANFRVLVLFYMHIMGFCHTLQTSSQPRSSGLHYFYPLHFNVQGWPGNSTHGLCTHHGSPHAVLCSFCYMAQWAITHTIQLCSVLLHYLWCSAFITPPKHKILCRSSMPSLSLTCTWERSW